MAKQSKISAHHRALQARKQIISLDPSQPLQISSNQKYNLVRAGTVIATMTGKALATSWPNHYQLKSNKI